MESPWWELSKQGRYLGWRWGSKIDPSPINLPSWPCYRHHHLLLLIPHPKITAPSADPPQRWNHTINLFIVLTLCSYRFSAGRGKLWSLVVLCPNEINITPCPMAILSTQRKLHREAIFTSSNHLSVPPQQKNIVRMHCFCLTLQLVWCRRNWSLPSRPRPRRQQKGRWKSGWCVDNTSCTN